MDIGFSFLVTKAPAPVPGCPQAQREAQWRELHRFPSQGAEQEKHVISDVKVSDTRSPVNVLCHPAPWTGSNNSRSMSPNPGFSSALRRERWKSRSHLPVEFKESYRPWKNQVFLFVSPEPSPHWLLPRSSPELPGPLFRDWLVFSWVVNLSYTHCWVRDPFGWRKNPNQKQCSSYIVAFKNQFTKD